MKLVGKWQEVEGTIYREYGGKETPFINSMASVRKQTIPTERPPLVSEVSANFL
jgi:hypothetical protein